MTGETLFGKELKKGLADVQAWRATPVGMWAWLFQRASAVLLLVLVIIHLTYPYSLLTQSLLLMAAIFHGMLGIRVMLLDLGASVKAQKILFGFLALLGAFVFVLVWKSRL